MKIRNFDVTTSEYPRDLRESKFVKNVTKVTGNRTLAWYNGVWNFKIFHNTNVKLFSIFGHWTVLSLDRRILQHPVECPACTQMEGNELVWNVVGNVNHGVGISRQRSGRRLKVRLRKWPRESRERYVVWQASQSFSCAALVNPALRASVPPLHSPTRRPPCFKKRKKS